LEKRKELPSKKGKNWDGKIWQSLKRPGDQEKLRSNLGTMKGKQMHDTEGKRALQCGKGPNTQYRNCEEGKKSAEIGGSRSYEELYWERATKHGELAKPHMAWKQLIK